MSDIILEALRELHNLREHKIKGKPAGKIVEKLVLDPDTDPADVIDFDNITDEQIESRYPPFIEHITSQDLYKYGWEDDETGEELDVCVEKWIRDNYPGKLDTSKPIPYFAEPLNDGSIEIEMLGPLHWLDQDVKKRNKIEEIAEDFNSSKPVTPLPVADIKHFIADLPNPADRVPPVFFKLGYMREIPVSSKYKGGRRSQEGDPIVRIVKCSEFSSLYTGTAWQATQGTKRLDKELGVARHTGERTGFEKSEDESFKEKIGVYANGKEALQAYIANNCKLRTKFFISLNDGDLVEASREEVAQYLPPSAAQKLMNSTGPTPQINAETGELADTAINRFLLDRIYMIGNLGHSVF